MEPLAHSRCSGNESDSGVTGTPAPRLGTEPFGSPLDRPSAPWPQHRALCPPSTSGHRGQEPEAGADESYPAVVRALSGRPRLRE